MRCVLPASIAIAAALAGCGDRPAADPLAQITGPRVYTTAGAALDAGVIDPAAIPPDSVWQVVEHPDGARSYGFLCDDMPVGFWTYTHANGRVAMQGSYLYGGVLDGEWTLWWENGNRQATGSYNAGKREGRWRWWHDNGTRSAQGDFSAGVKTGRWGSWYANGEDESLGSYVDGRRSGVWRFWNPDGSRVPYHIHTHPDTSWPEDDSPQLIEYDGYEPKPHALVVDKPYRPGGGGEEK